MPKEKNNPGYVTRADCLRNHAKINLALFGHDGRGGIVKDISDMKADVKTATKFINDQQKNQTEKKRDYRSFWYSVTGGLVVIAVTYLFSLFVT